MPTSNPYIDLPLLSLGVRPDLPSKAVPPGAARDASNILYRAGAEIVRPGLTGFGGGMAERPMGFTQYDHASESRRIVAGTTVRWARFDTVLQDWVDIADPAKLLTGTEASPVLFRPFRVGSTTWLLGVNGVDAPKKWDGDVTHTYVDIGGSPPAASCIAVARDMVLMAATATDPWLVRCSAVGNPDSGWGTLLLKSLSQTPGRITALMEMGGSDVMVYKEDSIYVGTPDVAVPWTFQPKEIGCSGPAGPAAVVALPEGNTHVALCRDGAVRTFDGVSFQSVGAHVQRWIQDRWDPTLMSRCWGMFDRMHSELWFVYPHRATGRLSHGIVLSYPSWSLYPVAFGARTLSAGGVLLTSAETLLGDVPFPLGDGSLTLGDYSAARWVVLSADASGAVFSHGGVTDDGDPISAYAQSGLVALGGEVIGFKQALLADHLFLPSGESQLVSFSTGVANWGEEPAFGTPASFDIGTSGRHETGCPRVSGRWHAFRYDIEASASVQRLATEVAFALRGRR